MSAVPNRFKQANAPVGPGAAAPTLPAQSRAAQSAVACGPATYSEPHAVGERRGHI